MKEKSTKIRKKVKSPKKEKQGITAKITWQASEKKLRGNFFLWQHPSLSRFVFWRNFFSTPTLRISHTKTLPSGIQPHHRNINTKNEQTRLALIPAAPGPCSASTFLQNIN